MEYNFREIEKKWRQRWVAQQTYKVTEDPQRPKFYVLNMFPYPSGAGLHVGHPLGYIASDIYARYKRLQGFNVLNPMGYDAYGLPAEQYAIQTGQHPAVTTEQNIARYREQLDKIGFSFDWSREVRTCEPGYYHWTQWAFQKMFGSFYSQAPLSSPEGDTSALKPSARPIEELVKYFEENGSEGLENYGVASSPSGEKEGGQQFTASEWRAMSEVEQQRVLMNYRIAYLAETMVNWCPALGTVLANDEVVNGVSERGGFPVEQKRMKQWCLRVSAYSQRLLDGLDTIDWTDSLKETQRNWIGRSEGAEIVFKVKDSDKSFTIFTTRADTMFGVTFMVLAPESELVKELTTPEQQAAVDEYLTYVKKRTERDRISDRKVTGVFSGSYAINPFTGEANPIWISEYVLAGYGTGAIMAVPAHDSRDYAFAKHFNLPIVPLVEGCDVSEESFDAKEGIVCNSPREGVTPYIDFSLNGLTIKEAIAATKKYVREHNLGRVKVNYRLRDAIFSRQRYWGEPFPVYYKDGMPQMIPEECLPLQLPEVDKFLPTETGEPPLGNAKKWAWDTKTNSVVDCSAIDNVTVFPLELNTMPGFAGSSAYYLRYMDPHNDQALLSPEADQYWQNVDLYVGGSEHATGHLIYSRFWNKFLFDLGVSCKEEPFQKLVNQGMIQGRSNFVYRIVGTNTFVSLGLKDKYEVTPLHVDVNIVSADVLDIEAFKAWRPEYANAEFILEDGKYVCGWAVEKMSKSMYNVVNPDMIVEKFGADTLRLYEMFLGPVEQAKPWDTNGIDGSHRFLKKFWNLFWNSGQVNKLTSKQVDTQDDQLVNSSTNNLSTCQLSDDAPTAAELKSLHKLIKKVTEDIEVFSYNTSVPAFMIAVNELSQLKCNKRAVLEPMVILIAPFAPHIAEELWEALGHTTSVCDAQWPKFEEKYLVEDTVKMMVAFNGKTRFGIDFPADADNATIEAAARGHELTPKYLEGKQIMKVIIVPKRMINIVCK